MIERWKRGSRRRCWRPRSVPASASCRRGLSTSWMVKASLPARWPPSTPSSSSRSRWRWSGRSGNSGHKYARAVHLDEGEHERSGANVPRWRSSWRGLRAQWDQPRLRERLTASFVTSTLRDHLASCSGRANGVQADHAVGRLLRVCDQRRPGAILSLASSLQFDVVVRRGAAVAGSRALQTDDAARVHASLRTAALDPLAADGGGVIRSANASGQGRPAAAGARGGPAAPVGSHSRAAAPIRARCAAVRFARADGRIARAITLTDRATRRD